MGDRAVIHVEGAACSAYLHWGGKRAIKLLEKAIPSMRQNDPDYSQARLIGVLHNAIEGNTGLGVVSPPKEEDYENNMSHYSQGDAGVLVYDCQTGNLRIFAGYLSEKEFTSTLPVPPK